MRISASGASLPPVSDAPYTRERDAVVAEAITGPENAICGRSEDDPAAGEEQGGLSTLRDSLSCMQCYIT